MVRLNLSSDDVRNFKETTVFVKEGNTKSPRSQEQVKLKKGLEKYLKSKVIMNFKYFQCCRNTLKLFWCLFKVCLKNVVKKFVIKSFGADFCVIF